MSEQELFPASTEGIVVDMRERCRACGDRNMKGQRTNKNGQAMINCAACGAWVYNAPKAELGEEPSQVRTRRNIKPGKKTRILSRDNHTCVACHSPDRPLHVGHLVSLEDGRALGATDEELDDEANLAAMCDECNLGLGRESVNPRLMLRCIRANIRNRDGSWEADADAS